MRIDKDNLRDFRLTLEWPIERELPMCLHNYVSFRII